MKLVRFASCILIVNYRQGWALTVYEDGTQIKSQSFSDLTASEFGYEPPDGKRLSCDHDLLHHWLGERLGSGSLNHWIVSHDGDKDTSRELREREERLVAGIMMLMNINKVPAINSWIDVPNQSSYYTDFAVKMLGSEAHRIAAEGKSYLNNVYETS